MISLTEKAVNKVTSIMKEQEVSNKTKIRVGGKGGGCSGFTYTVDFDNQKDYGTDFWYHEACSPYNDKIKEENIKFDTKNGPGAGY